MGRSPRWMGTEPARLEYRDFRRRENGAPGGFPDSESVNNALEDKGRRQLIFTRSVSEGRRTDLTVRLPSMAMQLLS
jgi:hypothetical protein